ncbi:hypothetical protein IKA15_01520 [bacterium]|nr:hypothetical protein [bacterium]
MTAINGIVPKMTPTSTGTSAVNIGIYNPSTFNTPAAEATDFSAAQSLAQNSQVTQAPINVSPEQMQAMIQQTVSAEVANALKNLASMNASQMYQQTNQANGLGEKKNNGVAVTTPPAPNFMPNSVMGAANAQGTAATAQGATPVEQTTPQAGQAHVQEAPASFTNPQQVQVEQFLKDLNSEDYAAQNEALIAISNISQMDKTVASQLNTEELMTSVANVISKDTSALEGPSEEELKLATKVKNGEQLTPEEQAIYDTRSPKEQAEKNKVYAIYTLAQLQKNLRDEIDTHNQSIPEGKEKVAQIKMPELIGFNEIMTAASNSEVPAVRKAAIQAISYVARPEESNGIIQILSNFTNDSDASVQEAAKKAIEKANETTTGQAQASAAHL